MRISLFPAKPGGRHFFSLKPKAEKQRRPERWLPSWHARKGAARIEVETVRFEDYEIHHPMRVDLVKIDGEDFEADVLEGMRGVIARDRPFIVCEVLPRVHGNKRTLDIVESFNYQPYWNTSVGYIKVPKFDLARRVHTDFLLSPVSTHDIVLDLPTVL